MNFILAIVKFLDRGSHRLNFVHQPFPRKPEFGCASMSYAFGELLSHAEAPR